MSRHRIVRSMNYSDEYDGYDDVYGHSVEDDYSMSPSDAAFMYDRDSRQPAQFSAFLTTEDDILEEEDETAVGGSGGRKDSFVKPPLSDVDEARLRSCRDEVQSVVGDSLPDSTLDETILRCDFDVARTLDALLQSPPTKSAVDKPPANLETSVSKTKSAAKHEGKDVPAVVTGLKLEESSVVSTASPSIKVAAIQSKSSTVVKGFDVPTSSNKTIGTPSSNKADVCNLKTGETSRSLSQSPEPERKPQSSAVGDKDTVQKTPHSNRSLKAEEEWKKRCSNAKEQLHMVTIGHVDAGKSTLMGHLLYRLGHVNQKTMHKYEQESKKMGKQSFVYAWILDETGEERSRGITMDVGQSQIETKSKWVTLLDAPGHKDFIPNMITGAAQADVALLVVDATRGEFETGFESGGQTREHALLVRSLGVNQLCVAVNKLDTVSWSEERFKEVVGKLQSFLKQAGFRDSDVTYVPCSGLTGENLTSPPTSPQLASWYTGPCLLDVIDKFKCPERPVSKPFRLSINDIFKGTGSGFCVSGRVETGMVQQGDKLLVQPLNETATVKALSIDEVSVQSAFAGDYVNVTIANIDQQNMAVGYILSDPCQPAPVTCKMEARIVIFNITVPITSGFPVVLHQQSLVEPAVIVKLVAQLHKSSGEVIKRRPRCLLRNTTALVVIETSRPVCVELYRNIKELGRLMLRSAGTTIAAGLVTKIL